MTNSFFQEIYLPSCLRRLDNLHLLSLLMMHELVIISYILCIHMRHLLNKCVKKYLEFSSLYFNKWVLCAANETRILNNVTLNDK